jgi:hypothetical protein
VLGIDQKWEGSRKADYFNGGCHNFLWTQNQPAAKGLRQGLLVVRTNQAVLFLLRIGFSASLYLLQ